MLKRIIILLLPVYIFSMPYWFHNFFVRDYEIAGYGADKDLQNARNIAKAEIAKTIKVQISSSTNINESLTDNEKYKKFVQNKISTSSDATLEGIKIVKEELKEGLWWVCVVYDNRTLLQKIKAKYPNFSKKQLKNLKKLQVIRKDHNWYLQIKNDLFLLKKEDFTNLFSTIKNKNLQFLSNKMIYISGNKINFKVISKNKGYISILYVENNGKVGVILPNAKIKQKLIYPSKKDKEALIAYNPYQKTISEMYVCIYSPTKLDLSEFENIDDDLLDESNYHFDKLLDIIQKNPFATIKIKIKGSV